MIEQCREAHWGLALQAGPVGGVLLMQRAPCWKKQGWKPNSHILPSESGAGSGWRRMEKKKIAAFIVDGGLNFTEENDEVLVVGFGCKGRAIFGDIPGVCFKVVKTDHVSLWPYSKARKRDYDSKF